MTELELNTRYELKVAASTAAGRGNYSDVITLNIESKLTDPHPPKKTTTQEETDQALGR